MNSRGDELKMYIARVRPIYNELFAMAYVMCGSYDQAEHALGRVIFGGFSGGRRFRSARAFAESMRAGIRRTAAAQGTGEQDWEFQYPGENADPILTALAAEERDVARVMIMRYGCGLSAGAISGLTGDRADVIKRQIRRVRRRLDRRMGDVNDTALREACREYLTSETEAPDMASMFRAFETEAFTEKSVSATRIGGIAAYVVYIAALLCLAIAIWAVSAVTRPANIGDDGLITEVLNEQ